MDTGIYIHIPFCKSKCCYCSFNSSSDLSCAKEYTNALINEINSRADKVLVCDTVHFGGGTPSVLHCGELTRIFDALTKSFTIKEKSEIAIEANPESCNISFIKECVDIGVNRLSLGLQSTSDELLKLIGRPHTYNDFLTALDLAQKNNITNVNADLIIGLPSQTLLQAVEEVTKITLLPLKHISIYPLQVEKGTPMYENKTSIDNDLQADMYDECRAVLNKNGFLRYEVSNFAKCGFMSRHNLKYWTLAPYLGFGLSAHSFNRISRLENTDNMADYLAGNTLANKIASTKKSLIEEYIMLSLRTSFGINLGFLKQELGYDLIEQKRNKIRNLVSKGLIVLKNDTICLNEQAYYIMDSVTIELLS